jgi:succinyl-CoA synthetase alpha subunit
LSIFVDNNTPLLVQGRTGKEGRFHSEVAAKIEFWITERRVVETSGYI